MVGRRTSEGSRETSESSPCGRPCRRSAHRRRSADLAGGAPPDHADGPGGGRGRGGPGHHGRDLGPAPAARSAHPGGQPPGTDRERRRPGRPRHSTARTRCSATTARSVCQPPLTTSTKRAPAGAGRPRSSSSVEDSAALTAATTVSASPRAAWVIRGLSARHVVRPILVSGSAAYTATRTASNVILSGKARRRPAQGGPPAPGRAAGDRGRFSIRAARLPAGCAPPGTAGRRFPRAVPAPPPIAAEAGRVGPGTPDGPVPGGHHRTYGG